MMTLMSNTILRTCNTIVLNLYYSIVIPLCGQPRLAFVSGAFINDMADLNIDVLEDLQWATGRLEGGFGYIERATWKNNDVAVKFLRPLGRNNIRTNKSLRQELKVWKEIIHPHILPLLGVVRIEDRGLGMASPYMLNGSARAYITRNPNTNVMSILSDVAEALRYLASHNPPIAHGDIKGDNVLIDPNGRALLCDFGLSRFVEDNSLDDEGTTRWMAPEQLREDVMFVSLPADVYSWGMLALELMTGTVPWSEIENDYQVIQRVLRGDRPQPRGAINDEMWALIQECWRHDPDKRPTAWEVYDALCDLRHRHHST
ncbi:unnamed protein product [Rhizoctonia solani]|uniref:Protein kinase domain-containing protein n=1 Tax=Rhizoctonia solani TaxID=456999 RepID=A0A8H3CZZ5_9AGAM|nr:unnamed protein product [Rhizoctonia solani]